MNYFEKYIKYKRKYLDLRGNDNLSNVINNDLLKVNSKKDNKIILSESLKHNYLDYLKGGLSKLQDTYKENKDEIIINPDDLIKKLNEEHYPYYDLFYNKTNLKNIFYELRHSLGVEEIRKEATKEILELNKITFKKIETDEDLKYKNEDILYKSTKSLHYEILTDYFVERVRLKCKNTHKNKTEVEIFNEFKNRFIENLKKHKSIKKSKDMFRKFYFQSCDLFPCDIATYVFSKYKPKNILDMSAGWGDRLIGALAYKCDNYYGVDPNIDLYEKYNDIIKYYKDNEGTYKIIPKKFEETNNEDFDNKKFDMMFSSPPYFLSEEYTKEKYYNDDVKVWLRDFIYVSLRKIWELLNDGGRIFLIIDDTYYNYQLIHYVDKIIKYTKGLYKCEFEGMQKYSHFTIKGKEVYQPIWVFKKN